MIFTFIDESGSAYRDYGSFSAQYCSKLQSGTSEVGSYPYFVLAALAIDESRLPVVDEWFDGIKKNFLGSAGFATGPQHEIKGNILYAYLQGQSLSQWRTSGKRNRRRYLDEQEKIWGNIKRYQIGKLEKSIFDLLRRIAPKIWVVVVDQPSVFLKHGMQTWPPLYWALTYLQQRVVHHVQRHYGVHQQALFLMDQTSHLSEAADFEAFFTVRDAINNTAPWPVDFQRWLIQVPMAGKSHLHQSLQLADIVAHSAFRYVCGRDKRGWFKEIEPFLATHWKNNSDYMNAGLTFIK